MSIKVKPGRWQQRDGGTAVVRSVKPLDPLRPVDVSAGMLAPLLSGEAMPFAEYSGEKASAVWLPNQDFAQAYRQYLEQGYVEDDTPPPAPQTQPGA